MTTPYPNNDFFTPSTPGLDSKGRTPLTVAAENGQVEVVNSLVVKHGLDPKCKYIRTKCVVMIEQIPM